MFRPRAGAQNFVEHSRSEKNMHPRELQTEGINRCWRLGGWPVRAWRMPKGRIFPFFSINGLKNQALSIKRQLVKQIKV